MSKLRESLVNYLYEVGNQSGCHQMPERSLFYKGHQLPVCARCTGVTVGQIAALIANLFTNISWTISVVYLGIMGIDWLLQETGIRMSNNFRRLFTGVLGGFGLFNLYCIIAKKLFFHFRAKHKSCQQTKD